MQNSRAEKNEKFSQKFFSVSAYSMPILKIEIFQLFCLAYRLTTISLVALASWHMGTIGLFADRVHTFSRCQVTPGNCPLCTSTQDVCIDAQMSCKSAQTKKNQKNNFFRALRDKTVLLVPFQWQLPVNGGLMPLPGRLTICRLRADANQHLTETRSNKGTRR